MAFCRVMEGQRMGCGPMPKQTHGIGVGDDLRVLFFLVRQLYPTSSAPTTIAAAHLLHPELQPDFCRMLCW